MQRPHSLFVALLLLSAANAQSLPGQNDSSTGAVSSLHSILPPQPTQKPTVRDFGRLPLSFESNRGQTNSQVRFLTHTADSTLFLTSSEAVFSMDAQPSRLSSEKSALHKDRQAPKQSGKIARMALRMQMVGANPRATVLQQQPLAGRVNYFIGKDPSKWHAGVPTFGRVGFQGVYPGVDLIYYGNQRHLEYDFVVAPHADPKQIQLHFAGAQGVRLNAAGDLVVRTEGRELKWQKPLVYQQDAAGKHPIVAHFHLKTLSSGQEGVSFALGHYDTDKPLVIDPVLVYSTYLGGHTSSLNNQDYASGIAVDADGNAYIVGTAESTDFPTTSGAFQKTQLGRCGFVTKMNPTGTALVYSTLLGGTAANELTCIAVDSSGDAYVAGSAGSADYPITSNAYSNGPQSSGLVVTKLDPTGSSLIYSAASFGSINSRARAIAIDGAGDAYLTGDGLSGLPTTSGAFQPQYNFDSDRMAFVMKLNPAGSGLVYSTYLGGSVTDFGTGIAVNSGGVAFVTGSAESTDFPVTIGAYQTVKPNQSEVSTAFITALSPDGSSLAYSTFLGGSSGSSEPTGIAIDSSGNAYVTGHTASSNFPTTHSAFQATLPSSLGSSFVTKLNPTGSALIYSTFLGGSKETPMGSGGLVAGIAVDSRGHASVTGSTGATDFPTTVGAFRRLPPAASTVTGFVTKLNSTGTGLLYSTFLGGSSPTLGGDAPSGIALDSNGNVYVTGEADSRDFPVTPGAFQTTNHASTGGENGFVTKLSPIPIFPDFNNDGFTDLLLQNASTGAITSWFMNGSTFTGSASFSLNTPLDYAFVGVGDFGGAGLGIHTLVFQSSTTNKIIYWYTGGTNNATITGGDSINATPTTGWKLVGIGDFNGDGNSDLVFQNPTTGQIAIWFMMGRYYQGGVLLPYAPEAGWNVVGVGDFNGDGQTDLAFQNQTTGQIAFWYLNGTTYIGGTLVSAVPAAGWKVVGVGDYNGDGIADLLFQNPTTNAAVVWYTGGGARIGGAQLSLNPPAGWHIVGPR